MKKSAKGLGLAIIGGGRVGLFRGEVAARHPSVEWIGLAEKNPNRAGEVGAKINADFVTQSHVELIKRPETTCAIIATDEHLHVEPIMACIERGIPMLIEKPLATKLDESARVLKLIKDATILTVSKDGTIQSREIVRSSGDNTMDQSVMTAAERVQQIDPLPGGLGNGEFFEINIAFKLDQGQ